VKHEIITFKLLLHYLTAKLSFL